MQPKRAYFTLHPFNRSLRGRRPTFTNWGDVLGVVLATMVSTALLPVMLDYVRSPVVVSGREPATIPYLMILLMTGIPFWFIIDLLRKWLLATKGRLLDGTITNAWLESRGVSGGSYYLCVAYEFESPSGKVVKGRTSAARIDLFSTDIPSAGTLIKVLYLNDYFHSAV